MLMPAAGLKIIEHPLLNDYRTEVYRGCGGYKYRWIIRKERQVLDRKIILIPFQNTVYCTPATAQLLRKACSSI